ncbi:MAG: hypothetical protein VX379_04495 [Pseudomonadota bacterium]|nr:hypothetical protein [Pseudomonadota bacterium]MEE3322169.1 hypothetical protein [Pseudomonadota bacterium]
MDGLSLINDEGYLIVHVDFLSEEIKESIRKNLTYICHGYDQADSGRIMFNYKNTLKNFLERYTKKSKSTQIGMIGELLSHVLILELMESFEVVSSFFNLEEKSIKKGFDILLFEREREDVWIVEVKSGELHAGKNSTETAKTLVGIACNDLNKRLNENEMNHWTNAVHAARAAIAADADYKKAVVNILMDEGDNVAAAASTSKDNNVFLVSALFSSCDEKVDPSMIGGMYSSILDKDYFRNVFLLSVKKSTYEAVAAFLDEESQDD